MKRIDINLSAKLQVNAATPSLDISSLYFVLQALIGQKYGYRPIPASIDGEEYEILRAELEERDEDIRLLDTWYLRDENVVPPQYILQPINAVLKNYDSSVNIKFV